MPPQEDRFSAPIEDDEIRSLIDHLDSITDIRTVNIDLNQPPGKQISPRQGMTVPLAAPPLAEGDVPSLKAGLDVPQAFQLSTPLELGEGGELPDIGMGHVLQTTLRASDIGGRVLRSAAGFQPEIQTGNLVTDLAANVATDPVFIGGLLRTPILNSFRAGKALLDDIPPELFGNEQGFFRFMRGDPDVPTVNLNDFNSTILDMIAPFRAIEDSFVKEVPVLKQIGTNLRNSQRFIGDEISQTEARLEDIFAGMNRKDRVEFGRLRKAEGDTLLENPRFAVAQGKVNELLDEARVTIEAEFRRDTSKWSIPAEKYLPQIHVGDYSVGRIVDGTFRTLDEGIGSFNDVMETASRFLKADPDMDILIKPRNMDFGFGVLNEAALDAIRLNPNLATKFTAFPQFKTALQRKNFFSLATRLAKEAELDKDAVLKAVSGVAKISPNQKFFGNLERRVSDIAGFIDDPEVALQMYSYRLIRKKHLESLVRPLFELANDPQLLARPGLKKVVTDRINLVYSGFDPLNQPNRSAFLARLREIQGARKLSRPSSALVNWMGPWQLAYPEVGISPFVWGAVNRTSKVGKELLKKIRVSGFRSMIDTGGEATAFGQAIKGALVDIKEGNKIKGVTALLTSGFRGIEKVNRQQVPLAGYKAAKNIGFSDEIALQMGRDLDDSTNFLYNAADVPKAIQTFPTLFQFQTFQVNYAYNFYRAMRDAVSDPTGRNAFGTNNVHRLMRFMAAQTVAGGIRSLPYALRYGTVASWFTAPFTTTETSERLRQGIDSFILENPITRGAFAAGTNYLSQKTGGAVPALDISTRVGMGDTIFPDDFQDMLGVNFQDVFTLIDAYQKVFVESQDPELVFRQSLRGDPLLRDALDAFGAFRGKIRTDEFRRARRESDLSNSEIASQALSFRPLREALRADFSRGMAQREQRLRRIKTNLIDKYILSGFDAETLEELLETFITLGIPATNIAGDVVEEIRMKELTPEQRMIQQSRRASRPEIIDFFNEVDE